MSKIAAEQANLLPHDLEAERAVLGSVLIDPDAMIGVRETGLRAGQFWAEKHRWVFDAACTLSDRNEPIDVVTIASVMADRQNGQGSQLEAWGGAGELLRLVTDTPTTVYVKHYAEIVKRTAQRRAIISVAGEMARLAQEHEGPIDALYDQVSRKLFDAVDVTAVGSHLYGSDDTLIEYLTEQQRRQERAANGGQALMKVWLSSVDEMLHDIPAGMLHAVVARSSIGKTVWMEQIAESNAKRGHKIAYYHYELDHQFMQDRRMARLSGIPLGRIRDGYNGPEVARAMDDLRTWHTNVTYIHCTGWGAERVAADMARLFAKGDCELAIVDYWQKIPLPDVKGLNAAQLVAHQVETLKNAAETLHIPVVMGSQVSRGFKNNEGRRPMLEDIRNSGELEDKANQIVILHRPDKRSETVKHGDVEMLEAWIEKNTGGATGMVRLAHVLGRYLLTPVAKVEDEF